MKKYPSRAQVFHGNGLKTGGGLRKEDLFKDTDGSIKSKAASKAAKKRVTEEGSKAMVRVFKAKKGEFEPQPKKRTKKYKELIKKMSN
jgi:hypothetical protein